MTGYENQQINEAQERAEQSVEPIRVTLSENPWTDECALELCEMFLCSDCPASENGDPYTGCGRNLKNIVSERGLILTIEGSGNDERLIP